MTLSLATSSPVRLETQQPQKSLGREQEGGEPEKRDREQGVKVGGVAKNQKRGPGRGIRKDRRRAKMRSGESENKGRDRDRARSALRGIGIGSARGIRKRAERDRTGGEEIK